MKKLSLLLVIASILFFASCEEKELTSLEGTTWKYHDKHNGGWIEYKLTFTSTHATYIETNDVNNNSGFTGTYTFDPPTVEIISDHWIFWGNPPEGTVELYNRHKGTVTGKTMKIGIACDDMVEGLELKKQ